MNGQVCGKIGSHLIWILRLPAYLLRGVWHEVEEWRYKNQNKRHGLLVIGWHRIDPLSVYFGRANLRWIEPLNVTTHEPQRISAPLMKHGAAISATLISLSKISIETLDLEIQYGELVNIKSFPELLFGQLKLIEKVAEFGVAFNGAFVPVWTRWTEHSWALKIISALSKLEKLNWAVFFGEKKSFVKKNTLKSPLIVKKTSALMDFIGWFKGLFLIASCLVSQLSMAANPASPISIAIPIIKIAQPTFSSFLCVGCSPPSNLSFMKSAHFSITRPMNTSNPPATAKTRIANSSSSDEEIAEAARKLKLFWKKCIIALCCFGLFCFGFIQFCRRH